MVTGASSGLGWVSAEALAVAAHTVYASMRDMSGPYAIGHECVAEVIETGPSVSGVGSGDVVTDPWAVSCGSCRECGRGLTAK